MGITKSMLAAATRVSPSSGASQPRIDDPPNITRNPSPTALADVFKPPAKPPPKKGISSEGLVLTSGFHRWFRPLVFPQKGAPKYSPAKIESDLASRRRWMHFNFAKMGTTGTAVESPDDIIGPVTRSAVDSEDKWLLDEEAFTMATTERRRLSRVPLEYVCITAEKKKLLLLVGVDDDEMLLKGKASKVDDKQGHDITTISGRAFYTLQCEISDSRYRQLLLTGERDRLYSLESFKIDFKTGMGGLQLKFLHTNIYHAFTWKEIQANPRSLMFFGQPTSTTRAFDGIFRCCTNPSTLHHRYISFYDEFEGDTTACLALENAYLHARRKADSQTMESMLAKARSYNPDLFKSEAVIRWAEGIDELFRSSMESVFTEFKNHADPIVSADDLQAYIDDAPSILGDYWHLQCDLRGVKPNQKAEKDRNVARIRTIFFNLLAQLRLRNRRLLRHWALVGNIADYARGVKSGAEKAAAYNGNKVHPTTRSRIFARLTGNDIQGRADGNTLEMKQRLLLRSCRAIIVCYDNFQRGVSLLNQRGETPRWKLS